jgi:hypothetical protein
MKNSVKVAIIIVLGLALAVGIYVYFSPYQSCVRAYSGTVGASTRGQAWVAQKCIASQR